MKRIGIGLLSAAIGYVLGAVGGWALVQQLSDNLHDRDVEAAMTGAFIAGPAAAVIALGVGLALGKGRSSQPNDSTGPGTDLLR